jgi:mono/diheme cytochrome c family protein
MTARHIAFSACAAALLFVCVAEAADPHAAAQGPEVIRGRYLVQIGGCNDCHTPGYLETEGNVEEAKWLTGSALGWRGPWGTTYAPNIRLTAKDMTAEQFMARVRGPLRPPMPYFNLRAMRDGDVKAIYAFIKSLGPAGDPAPDYLPPDKAPTGPFVTFPAPPK